MLNRRSFLHRSLATGLGLYSVGVADNDLLGHSRLRSLILEYPFSPNRVIVMDEEDYWPSRGPLPGLGTSLAKRLDLSPKKLDMIDRLMQALTNHYHAPHLLRRWARTLAVREALGSTAVGYGFGLLHQFQDDGWVRLANPPADWWLVLFSDGVEWDSADEKPVFGMIGHVFPHDHLQRPGLKLRAYCLATSIGNGIRWDEPDAWARIARMDRYTAAKVVNEFVRSIPAS